MFITDFKVDVKLKEVIVVLILLMQMLPQVKKKKTTTFEGHLFFASQIQVFSYDSQLAFLR